MTPKTATTLTLGMLLAANGACMLFLPAPWYAHMPGVTATGPLNAHFIRDIGAAYLVAGGGLIWLWRNPHAWPAALSGSAFLMLHALVHIGEAVVGTFDWKHLVRDLPGVFFVPLLASWLAWPRRDEFSTKENSNATMDRTAQARRV
ncbi:MAG TPA: hypothetical protein VFF81_10850 [Noviherbaspirillum sp.]|nr:hypothetical protein [Noviherbaspirillum sp.]